MPQLDIRLYKELLGHKGAIYTLAHSNVTEKIVSAGSEGWIVEWDPLNKDEGVKIADCADRIFSLLVWPESDLIIAGGMSGDVFFINRTGASEPRRMRLHRGPIYRLLAIGDTLLAVGGDGMISMWNPVDVECIGNLKTDGLRWRSAAYDPELQHVFLGDNQGQIHRLQIPQLELTGSPQKRHGRTIFSILVEQEANTLITGGLDALLCISDRNGNDLKSLNAHWFCINDIKKLSGLPFFASASRDKSIRIWDADRFDLVKELSKPKFAGHHHSVNNLLWMPEEHILCSAGEDARILIWKIQ